MDHYEHLIHALHYYPSKTWLNLYFDLQKRLLEKLELENEDMRLALSLTGGNKMPVNIGQRYVLKPHKECFISCIVPLHFEEAAAGGECVFIFRKNKQADAKWIKLPFDMKNPLPQFVWESCLSCCEDILQHSHKSGYRKYHVPLLFDFTMERPVRNEILNEVNIVE